MSRDECSCFCRSTIVNGTIENGDFDELNSRARIFLPLKLGMKREGGLENAVNKLFSFIEKMRLIELKNWNFNI